MPHRGKGTRRKLRRSRENVECSRHGGAGQGRGQDGPSQTRCLGGGCTHTLEDSESTAQHREQSNQLQRTSSETQTQPRNPNRENVECSRGGEKGKPGHAPGGTVRGQVRKQKLQHGGRRRRKLQADRENVECSRRGEARRKRGQDCPPHTRYLGGVGLHTLEDPDHRGDSSTRQSISQRAQARRPNPTWENVECSRGGGGSKPGGRPWGIHHGQPAGGIARTDGND
jgi:hypothetical protein